MPVRVPLDPVSVVESAPVAVAEASGAAPLPRPESGDAPPPAEEATAAPTPSADPQVSAAAAAPSAADEPR
jgi:hypothetical protein